MIRRKQNLIQTKETPASRPNAKVTVQYIQHHRQPSPQSNPTPTNHHDMTTTQPPEELEVENVEYLEEATNGEDFIDEHSGAVVKEDDAEDIFYPNAIHCLLDLYKDKYENVINKYKRDEKIILGEVWQDIAKEMHESYFEFEAEQIRQKYSALRQQYFDVKTSSDVDNFEYFEQMHEIYKDPGREIIAKGAHVGGKIVSEIIYKDDIVVKTMVCDDANQKVHKDDFKSDEIVHKEHEFIDMVEKGMLAMEQQSELETEANNSLQEDIKKAEIPRINPESITNIVKIEQNNLKRSLDEESQEAGEPVKRKQKLNQIKENPATANASQQCPETLDTNSTDSCNILPSAFSLFHYNEQQERRHREHMQLLQQQQQQQRDQLTVLEKSLKLHENTLNQQSLLLQELIKRFPPA